MPAPKIVIRVSIEAVYGTVDRSFERQTVTLEGVPRLVRFAISAAAMEERRTQSAVSRSEVRRTQSTRQRTSLAQQAAMRVRSSPPPCVPPWCLPMAAG